MPIHRCPDPASAEDALSRSRQDPAAVLFLFFGSQDPATGASWCPDCVTADPVLRSVITRVRPDLVLYECPVGPRDTWKGRPDHPYRRHPVFRLERIPTLIRIEGGCELGRLVEADCARQERIEAFLR